MSKAKTAGERLPEATEASLERLYRRHSSWLTASIRRRFGRDAEDVVQETWLRVAPLGALAELRHPKAFLLRVASNLAINRALQTKRRQAILETVAPLEADGQGADQLEAVQLQQMIEGLPQPLRDVFLLSRLGGLSTARIAEELQVSRKTVEWRLSRAMAHCAAQLRRDEGA